MRALRRILLIEFALAKFGALLRRTTSNEPAIASEFLTPASDVANAAVESGTAETQTVETDSAPADAATAEPAETNVVDIDGVDAAAVAIESIEAVTAESDPVELVAVPADHTVPSATPDCCSGQEADNTGVSAPAPKLIAIIPVEINAADPDAGEANGETDIARIDPVEAVVVAARNAAPAVAGPDDLSERERLVRRRWEETGIRMWNPRVHGAGQAALCIQGSVALLPPKPSETMPQYDRLEFRLLDGVIVCEGFVVDPPERPRRGELV